MSHLNTKGVQNGIQKLDDILEEVEMDTTSSNDSQLEHMSQSLIGIRSVPYPYYDEGPDESYRNKPAEIPGWPDTRLYDPLNGFKGFGCFRPLKPKVEHESDSEEELAEPEKNAGNIGKKNTGDKELPDEEPEFGENTSRSILGSDTEDSKAESENYGKGTGNVKVELIDLAASESEEFSQSEIEEAMGTLGRVIDRRQAKRVLENPGIEVVLAEPVKTLRSKEEKPISKTKKSKGILEKLLSKEAGNKPLFNQHSAQSCTGSKTAGYSKIMKNDRQASENSVRQELLDTAKTNMLKDLKSLESRIKKLEKNPVKIRALEVCPEIRKIPDPDNELEWEIRKWESKATHMMNQSWIQETLNGMTGIEQNYLLAIKPGSDDLLKAFVDLRNAKNP